MTLASLVNKSQMMSKMRESVVFLKKILHSLETDSSYKIEYTFFSHSWLITRFNLIIFLSALNVHAVRNKVLCIQNVAYKNGLTKHLRYYFGEQF